MLDLPWSGCVGLFTGITSLLSISTSKSLGSAPSISSPVTVSVLLPVYTMSDRVSCSCIEVLAVIIVLVGDFLGDFLSISGLAVSSSSCFVISSNNESSLLNIRLDQSSLIVFGLCVFGVLFIGCSWFGGIFSVLTFISSLDR